MKTIGVVCLLMVLGASDAAAVEIQGKWGIGAGVFGKGGEISLIRGTSSQSAWLFDVGIGQVYETVRQEVSPEPPFPLASSTRRTFSISAGPGYRRFTRPTEELSPYWDVRVRGLYSRTSNTSGTDTKFTQAGALGDFSIGLEYFTPWHFSIAAHTGVAALRWIHAVDTQTVPAQEARFIRNSASVEIGIAPLLFVRGYF